MKHQIATMSLFEQHALFFLCPLKRIYPDFESWYLRKVIPGKLAGTHRVFLSKRSNTTIAGGIAINTAGVKKISTLYIPPDYTNQVVTGDMVDRMVDWLECKTPIISISKENIQYYPAVIKQYGWVYTSYYNNEYVFNEPDEDTIL